jgi:hypothetical protein
MDTNSGSRYEPRNGNHLRSPTASNEQRPPLNERWRAHVSKKLNGSLTRIRTSNLPVNSRALYR